MNAIREFFRRFFHSIKKAIVSLFRAFRAEVFKPKTAKAGGRPRANPWPWCSSCERRVPPPLCTACRRCDACCEKCDRCGSCLLRCQGHKEDPK